MNNLKDMEKQKKHFELILNKLREKQKELTEKICNTRYQGNDHNLLGDYINERMKIDYQLTEHRNQLKDINKMIFNHKLELQYNCKNIKHQDLTINCIPVCSKPIRCQECCGIINYDIYFDSKGKWCGENNKCD